MPVQSPADLRDRQIKLAADIAKCGHFDLAGPLVILSLILSHGDVLAKPKRFGQHFCASVTFRMTEGSEIVTQEKDWWRGSVTYQIYPKSFQDSNGDGIGDLAGIISRLDHVAALGVDAIWLSPIFTSPMVDNGYDVADYCNIDPVFGTLADFDALVTGAHALGLRVIIDQVLNHCSDQHPMFQTARQSRDNPYADWFVWADPNPDGTPPNNWQSVFGGSAWEWETRRHQYYLHNFMRAQPDFNFHNPAVQDWALGTLRFWLDRGVDGFRFDTVNFYFHDPALRNDAADFRAKDRLPFKTYDMQYHLFSKNQPENLIFLQRVRALMDEYGATTSVGEVGEDHHPIEMMGEYTSNQRLHMAYSFGMMGYDFTPDHFRNQIETFFRLAPKGWPCWAFSNHDVVRHPTRWAADDRDAADLARLSCALLLCFEGSICIYQGEELGQTQTDLTYDELIDPQGKSFWPDDKGRDGCRTPMVWSATAPMAGFSTANQTWLPIKSAQIAQAADLQSGQPGSVLEFYQQMIALRRGSPDLRLGATRFRELGDGVLGFERGDNTLCVFNMTAAPVALATDLSGSVLVQQHLAHTTLGPLGFVVIARD
jgi:alpha-glucosidase